MGRIAADFDIRQLPGDPRTKTALLIAPPVYDTQYWAEWSQPYGLTRITALLKKHRYKRIEFFDFLETDEDRQVQQRRIRVGEKYGACDEPTRPLLPYVVEKDGQRLELPKYHFGKSWQEFDAWLDAQGFSQRHPPTEIWISAVMTYWWESTRDLITRLRNKLGERPRIILGGIYPSLAPKHAARYTGADIVVAGEVKEANDLWNDLSFYATPPVYSIITPSRGCPFNCSYCAQRQLNDGRNFVHFRPIDDILAEMRFNYETYGIRDFCFYADFLLWRFQENLMPLLKRVVAEKLPFRFYAPEGLDVNMLAQSQELVDLLKQARFQKIYLPCESLDDAYVKTLNRKHVKLHHFVKAAAMCEKAGFKLRNLDVNAFVLYGLPGEKIDRVVRTALFVSDVVGSIIPMLFTPVPSTALFENCKPWLMEHGWHERDLHFINGKLFPFLNMNEGSVADYIDLQRMMFMLNSHYRSESFQVYGDTRVSISFRHNIANGFGGFIEQQKQSPQPMISIRLPKSNPPAIRHIDIPLAPQPVAE